MKHSRREFFRKSTIGAAVLWAYGIPETAYSSPGKQLEEIGLITGVLRKQIEQDWRGTLRKVTEIGYRYLEFGNFMGDSREDFLKFMKEINLVPLAGGTAIAQMKKEDEFKKLIQDSLALGKKYMICYWPWMDGGDNKKLDDFRIAADDLNTIGEICHREGIRFLFHNHDKEFVPVEGFQWGYEVLLKNTDPSLVGMELDLYWIYKGGGDPITLFEQYPGRYEIFHVKDMDNTDKKLYTCPGYGVIDFASVFSRSREAGVKYYIVEIDEHPEPIQCIEDSYKYLKSLSF